MKKKNVVKKYSEFQEILNTKKFKKNYPFVIYYNNRKYSYSRVGILITKKHGNAVIRNKIKRQIREMISELLSFNEEYDFIITFAKNYDVNCFHQYKKTLKSILFSLKGENNKQKN